jgi:hypothetical protein
MAKGSLSDSLHEESVVGNSDDDADSGARPESLSVTTFHGAFSVVVF